MAGLLLGSVWCLLLLGGALHAPLVLTYLACAALLLWTRPRASGRPQPMAEILSGAAGFVALAAWLAVVWAIGRGLDLAPPERVGVSALGAPAWLTHVALAPVFEELLYRERLLPALRARLGAPLALVLSSAAFAAPHLEPWSVLTTFCVGLALGGVLLAAGRVELCIAYHAGLNAAVLVCGLPPERAALTPAGSLLASATLLALACAWTRSHEARARVHAGPLPERAASPHRA